MPVHYAALVHGGGLQRAVAADSLGTVFRKASYGQDFQNDGKRALRHA